MRKIVSSLVAAGVLLLAADAAMATQAVKKPVAQAQKPATKAEAKSGAATAKKPDSKAAKKAGVKSVKKPGAKDAKKTAAKNAEKKPFKLPKLPPPSLTGIASVYHYKKPRRGASGEILKFNTLIAAHRTFRFGTKVKVTNRRNGKSVVVRIVDRGPYIRGRVIDLSPAAARQIGIGWTIAPVTLAVINGKKA